MLSQWRWVVVGATIAAAVLTPSTDPFTQVRDRGSFCFAHIALWSFEAQLPHVTNATRGQCHM
eukprot:1136295-Pelagomonas_calceolata.AAC.2